MTLTPSKEKKRQTALLFAIVVCAFFFVQTLKQWSWGITLLFLWIFSICIRQWIATGRTFLLDAEGISIKFLWFMRTFPWNEITYAGTFRCEDFFAFGRLYAKGIEFSFDHKKRPRWMGVGLYAMHVRPMKYIYIYFGPQTQISKRNGYPPEYEADETVLRQLLQKWNVSIVSRSTSHKEYDSF